MFIINIPGYSIIVTKRRKRISKNNDNDNDDNDYLTNNIGFYNNNTNTYQE